MKLTFVNEGSIVYGIVNDAIYKGKVHDELLYCEIDGSTLRWEDSFFNKHEFTTVEAAKKAATKEFIGHIPHSNGNSYEI